MSIHYTIKENQSSETEAARKMYLMISDCPIPLQSAVRVNSSTSAIALELLQALSILDDTEELLR